ncbi:hypothetical protein RHSIM_Rhsim07G0073800 [Rhododendron simsii]|uniref:DUF295 domain-containing protein n=1 Tax=Rhododendron simsii TaxID=118357 RepID=A0A834LLB3_RHOSS|nr:hypothetical protein RHSIM_Rhsim07G0073800 [Rhododendron simsii]
MGNLRRLIATRPLFLATPMFSRSSLISGPITEPGFSGLPRGSHSLLPVLQLLTQKFRFLNHSPASASASGTGGGSDSSSVRTSAVEEKTAPLLPMLMLFPDMREPCDGFGSLVNCPFLIPSSSSSQGEEEEEEMGGDIRSACHDAVLPEVLRNSRCVGSSHGWLAFINTFDCGLYLSSLPLTAASASAPHNHNHNTNAQSSSSSSAADSLRPSSPVPLFTIQLPRIITLPHLTQTTHNEDVWPCPSFQFLCRKDPRFFDMSDFCIDMEACFPVSPKDLSETFVHKIILSAPPALLSYHNNEGGGGGGATVLVMAILGGEFRDIAFCRLADADSSSWTLLNKVDSGGYADIMYSQSDKRLYAIRDCDLKLEAWDLRDPEKTRSTVTATPIPDRDNVKLGEEFDNCKKKYYLVESLADILVVRRYVAHQVDNNGKVPNRPYRTVDFRVMKLNSDRDDWEIVKDLGDRVLFVGLNQSVSVSAAELNLRPNSIYFADDSVDLMHKSVFKEPYFSDRLHFCDKRASGGHDFGVFNLKDGRVTGRSPTIYKQLRKEKPLLTPDITALSLGTEIMYSESMILDSDMEQLLNKNWNRDIVNEETAKYPELSLQVSNAQEELLEWHAENAKSNPNIIHASERCAAAIIQAIGYFHLGPSISPRDVSDFSECKEGNFNPGHEVVTFYSFYERWRRAEVQKTEQSMQKLRLSFELLHECNLHLPLTENGDDKLTTIRQLFTLLEGGIMVQWRLSGTLDFGTPDTPSEK